MNTDINTAKLEQPLNATVQRPVGFVAGTPVAIDWYSSNPRAFDKPIEQLVVGDVLQSVLVQADGRTATTRVTRITTSEQPIWYVSFYELDGVDEYSLGVCRYVGVTCDQLFSVIGRCVAGADLEYAFGGDLLGTTENFKAYPQPIWKRADQLEFNDVLQPYKADKIVAVAIAKPLYQYDPEQPNLAWMHGLGDDDALELGPIHDNGLLFDFAQTDAFCGTFTCLYGEVSHPLWDVDGEGIDEPDHHFVRYCTTVYHIDVEDQQTYLISRLSLAVADATLHP